MFFQLIDTLTNTLCVSKVMHTLRADITQRYLKTVIKPVENVEERLNILLITEINLKILV